MEVKKALINVIYLSPAGYIGGAERSLIDLVANLPAEKFRSLVVSLSPGRLAGKLEERGVETEEIFLHPLILSLSRLKGKNSFLASIAAPFLSLPAIFKLRGLVRARRIDIIHTNGIRAHLLGIALSLLSGKTLIWHFHDQKGASLRLFRAAARFFPKRIIANSNKVKEELGGLEKIEVVYNGVDDRIFTDRAGEGSTLEELGLDRETLLIGTVGHFYPRKGYEDLVKAMPLILDKVPRARFLIVGEATGPNYEEYKRRVEELVRAENLSDKACFLGYREDVPRILSAIDIFVLPSRSEGFGLTNLEAMAAGKPVVSTGVGGIPEVVKDGETGYLVFPHQPEKLAEAVIKLALDPGLRGEMGRAGRKRAELFTVRKMVEGVTAVYREALSRR